MNIIDEIINGKRTTVLTCSSGCSPQINKQEDGYCYYCKKKFIEVDIPQETIDFFKSSVFHS
jgi:hypothetical protein